MVSEQLTQLVDRHVFLSGRPPMGEYLGFLKASAVNGDAGTDRVLADEWRAANDHIAELEANEAGIVDNPAILPLSEELQPLLGRLVADPIFQKSFSVVPAEVRVVELDRLIVFQKNINLNFVEEIQAKLGPNPSPEDIFQICLPFEHPTPSVQAMSVGQNSFAFVSPSGDLRVLDLQVFSADQISRYAASGPISGVVALVVGFGSNFLNAVSAENRLVLSNGSHRAYALRDLGMTHAPCIVQTISRREELEVVVQPIHANPDLYLRSPRPPMLKDYFDERLRKIVRVPRKLRQVRVGIQFEQLDMPAV